MDAHALRIRVPFCYRPGPCGASPVGALELPLVKVRFERLDGRVLYLELHSLAPVLALAPPFLGDKSAKGPFTARDMAQFVLVEGDETYYREVVRDESGVDPYR